MSGSFEQARLEPTGPTKALRLGSILPPTNDHYWRNRHISRTTVFRRMAPVGGNRPEGALRVECGRPSPRFLESAAPIGGDAYAGVSSTMRPSLQLYLASKSAFTVAAS